MFHVLEKGADVLLAETTKVLCPVKTPREAISLKRFVQYYEQKKLNTQRCCKVCFQKAVPNARQL